MIRLQSLDALMAASTPETPARLVSRPHGVHHLYVGPLTPSGAVPRNRRPVCKAHTRRLYVDGGEASTQGTPRLVCARCSARLVGSLPGRAETPTVQYLSKAQDRQRYQGLTVVDVYLSARFAVTVDELDECALVLSTCFTKVEAVAEHTAPTGRTFTDLPQWINSRRLRVGEAERDALRVARTTSRGRYFNTISAVDQERQREAHRERRRQAV